MSNQNVNSEVQEKITQALYYLERIVQDMGIPRNIRRAASESAKILKNSQMSPSLRAATVIGILDDVLSDPNMPLFSRVMILQIIAVLEQVRD
ncbi:MAG: UPF0147 family protein [Thermocladium sp.]